MKDIVRKYYVKKMEYGDVYAYVAFSADTYGYRVYDVMPSGTGRYIYVFTSFAAADKYLKKEGFIPKED